MIPCSRIAQIAREAECQVRVLLDEQIADARNVLDLLMLKAEEGTTLLIESEGDGAEEILARVVKLFEDNFELPSEN
jgi:phosphotransferase system HPr (HPr) family protein